MTVPATTVPATDQAPVQLTIPQDLLLEILRLPEGTQIDGASAAHWPGPQLIPYLRIPGAPEGADEVVPQYDRIADVPDPVKLTELQWLRGGHKTGVTRGGWD